MRRMMGFLVMAMVVGALVMPAVTEAKASPKVEGEIKAVLKKHGEFYKAKDLKGVMSLYAKGPDVISIGSEEGKDAIGYEQISAEYKKAFAAITELKIIDYSNLNISTFGNVAWVYIQLKASLIMAQGGKPVDIKGRFTAVLKKDGKQWQFVQTHFSEVAKPVVITFEEIDVNKDGKIDYKEMTIVIKGMTPEQFNALDKNKDGVITKDEYQGYMTDEQMQAVWARPHNIF
ncbi:MAG: nuclear transport factor 2 family protein [Deltaproteobacteria bacterium]|nr:nuclear transport factor 2 family protein [Deltaproteobacteria bacterium]